MLCVNAGAAYSEDANSPAFININNANGLKINAKAAPKVRVLALSMNDEVSWSEGSVFKIRINHNDYKLYRKNKSTIIVVRKDDPKYKTTTTKKPEHYFEKLAASRGDNKEGFIVEPPKEYKFSLDRKDLVIVSWKKSDQDSIVVYNSDEKPVLKLDAKGLETTSFRLSELFTRDYYTITIYPKKAEVRFEVE